MCVGGRERNHGAQGIDDNIIALYQEVRLICPDPNSCCCGETFVVAPCHFLTTRCQAETRSDRPAVLEIHRGMQALAREAAVK